MIVCSNCSSGQFLQITKSRVVLNKHTPQLKEVEEKVECTLCGNTGKVEIGIEGNTRRTSITGDVEQTDEEPRVSP